jgi:hypothetical protein
LPAEQVELIIDEMGPPTDPDIERRHEQARREAEMYRKLIITATQSLTLQRYGTVDLLHGKRR